MGNIDSILVQDRKNYFTYDGSLTTPPCAEVVIWIEFKNQIFLSHEQVIILLVLNNLYHFFLNKTHIKTLYKGAKLYHTALGGSCRSSA